MAGAEDGERGGGDDPGVVIAGAGVGGLAAALALGRAGQRVTVLDQDDVADAGDPEAAFTAERRGAPQVHQTHGFLARLVVELRQHLPDVLDALLAAGCSTLPTTADLGEPRPGDEDLAVLIVRRTTFEWILRRAVVAEPRVELRGGAPVVGLVADERPARPGAVPRVTGVRLAGGATLPAEVVIAATGRRGPIPAWLADIGVEVPEIVHHSGLMYLTRWYRLAAGGVTELDPKLGGDLGFVKYLGVPGDGDTLSITLAVRPDDRDLRSALSDPDGFEAACRLLPGPDQFFTAGPLQPIGGVRPMGGLLNRVRRFVDGDGAPTVTGFHAVGDAHTCTNPLYGRGCTLAVVQALRLAAAHAASGGDPVARAAAYERACAAEVEPWFDVSVQMDRMGADPAGALGGTGPQARGMRAVLAAAATDPVIGRAMVRFWNLLSTPAELAADAEFVARSAAVAADPDSHLLPDPGGPSRDQLLAALTDRTGGPTVDRPTASPAAATTGP